MSSHFEDHNPPTRQSQHSKFPRQKMRQPIGTHHRNTIHAHHSASSQVSKPTKKPGSRRKNNRCSTTDWHPPQKNCSRASFGIKSSQPTNHSNRKIYQKTRYSTAIGTMKYGVPFVQCQVSTRSSRIDVSAAIVPYTEIRCTLRQMSSSRHSNFNNDSRSSTKKNSKKTPPSMNG